MGAISLVIPGSWGLDDVFETQTPLSTDLEPLCPSLSHGPEQGLLCCHTSLPPHSSSRPVPKAGLGRAVAGNMEGRLEAPSTPAALCPIGLGQGSVAAQGFTMPLYRPCRGSFATPNPVNAAFQCRVSEGGGPRTLVGVFIHLVLVLCPRGPVGLGLHLNTYSHTEPCPHCGPSGQRSPSCDSCLHPSPRQQRAQPSPPLPVYPSQPASQSLPAAHPHHHTHPAGHYRVS